MRDNCQGGAQRGKKKKKARADLAKLASTHKGSCSAKEKATPNQKSYLEFICYHSPISSSVLGLQPFS